MFSKILVGTDGSETAVRALKSACDLTKTCNAELHIVHVPRPETVAFALGAMAGYAYASGLYTAFRHVSIHMED